MNIKTICVIISVALGLNLSAQNVVTRNDTVKVIHGVDSLELAWASGINAAHVSELDFNLDGLMDIFIFEPNTELNLKMGDKIFPFINTGGSGLGYRYAPEYRADFINNGIILEGMVLLRDYNCDGKMDIFTQHSRQGYGIQEYLYHKSDI